MGLSDCSLRACWCSIAALEHKLPGATVCCTQEVELLGRLSGFEVAAVHGDFNREVPLEHDEAYRMIICLRRAAAAKAPQ